MDPVFNIALLLFVIGRPWLALFLLVITGRLSFSVRGKK